MTAGDFAFGSLVLSTDPYFVTNRDISGPPIEVLSAPRGTREGAIVSHVRRAAREIVIGGEVHGTNKATLEANWDALLMALHKGEQDLKIGADDERIFRAHLQDFQAGGWYPVLTYQARFFAADPFAYAAAEETETDNTALSADGGGVYHKDIVITPGGSIYARPRLTIVVPAATSYGITSIAIRNVTIPQAVTLTITRNFVASDTLIVDSSDFSVTVNGEEQDYAGAFPVFDPRDGATNTIRITARAAITPTLNCTFEWTPRYL